MSKIFYLGLALFLAQLGWIIVRLPWLNTLYFNRLKQEETCRNVIIVSSYWLIHNGLVNITNYFQIISSKQEECEEKAE